MRGKRVIEDGLDTTTRITPAGAGKTSGAGLRRFSPEDHPRRCGENGWTIARGHTAVGSPPQVRGKRKRIKKDAIANRITPAGAGKTLGFSFPFDVYKDHPRRCGENSYPQFYPHVDKGSPPQVRGKLHRVKDVVGYNGITPAGAGKTTRPGQPGELI